ncbi:PaaI family thioesterase [Natrarchaeobius halalkaliphilus]|uniref:PaaI family thioesterase n=1 Tax=Natrarchaeobius halalkaliphilus TaxID=1679091 RepID=A0A3N6M6C9_9EURY|nr:PaaI family thioesterase [Natrarchaeobius halalkaliphilus]RQG91620.1 PaaI family thioesterase [Natrarchaeobius halalkaliphilus]
MSDDRHALAGDLDELAEIIQTSIDDNQEFLSWLGTTVDGVDEGTMTLSIPYDEKLTNTRSNAPNDRRADIHGGVAATLIDTVGGLALRTELEDPLAASIATINLNVNYLRPATGDLVGTATVIRAGSSIGVSEVVVESTTPDGRTREVVTGQGSYRLFRND